MTSHPTTAPTADQRRASRERPLLQLRDPARGRARRTPRRRLPRLRAVQPADRRPLEQVVSAQTLFERVWDAHVVVSADEPSLLYVDLHLVHEVTSPQAFEGLRLAGRPVRRPDLTLATMDHNVPTDRRADHRPARAGAARRARAATARSSACRCYATGSGREGIVHVIGPELGLDPAGDDDRLRRQPHLDARRVRGARVRDRHVRGRARARDADACRSATEDDADALRRRARRSASPPRTSSSERSARSASHGGVGLRDRVRRRRSFAASRWTGG